MFSGFLILLTIKHANSDQEISGHVVRGEYTNIYKHPHAVYLDVCSDEICLCGGSILNQDIVLTAAHCFDQYLGRRGDQVVINYGGSSVEHMTQQHMRYYRLHDDYHEATLFADIGLVRPISSLRLTNLVKRVAIMMQPPKDKLAYVSGWGAIDNRSNLPRGLKYTKQTIQSHNMCVQYLSLPRGAFCAGAGDNEGYPNNGDSGAALVVNEYIQVGIVSFKQYPSTLAVYTNVSYYYSWIKENSAGTYCARP